LPTEIAAVVGLGNPGAAYERTRHNIGFRVVDALAARLRVTVWERRYSSLVARRRRGAALLLAKPTTFMNLSGDAVGSLCRGEKITPERCLVIVDDVELPLGQLRLRATGGPGSHNGMRSLVEAIGEGFPRLRLGIRGPEPWQDLADYVLAEFDPEEQEAVAAMVERAVACLEEVLRVGIPRAATRFNASASPSDP